MSRAISIEFACHVSVWIGGQQYSRVGRRYCVRKGNQFSLGPLPTLPHHYMCITSQAIHIHKHTHIVFVNFWVSVIWLQSLCPSLPVIKFHHVALSKAFFICIWTNNLCRIEEPESSCVSHFIHKVWRQQWIQWACSQQEVMTAIVTLTKKTWRWRPSRGPDLFDWPKNIFRWQWQEADHWVVNQSDRSQMTS